MNRIFLLPFFLFALTTISAQSLMDQMGGIGTNFTIMLDDQPMEVASQYIIERMERNSEAAGKSYHFEFTLYNVPINENNRRLRIPMTNRISFLDENGKTLGFVNRSICQLRIPLDMESSSLSSFNFDLHQIPLSVLQHCRTIKLSSRQ
ncbi:MAG: hypothetical protein AAFR36_32560 [Bacteroidota bacterium]